MHELYIALTPFLGDSCTSEHMSSARHFYAWYYLVSVENGSVEQKNSIMQILDIGLSRFLGEFCTSDHMSFIRHFYMHGIDHVFSIEWIS